MDMETYLTGFKTARRRMEKEDPDTKISQKAMAVRLLQRSGLTLMERKQVLSAAGAAYDLTKSEE
jgi:hypothetical protein